ncbi:MAG: MBL fold metallo-hydrolase [Paracoccaceae bacterium]|nr:MBL fold metallo-hydrolase [Paracoccaceae bacterium]
MQDRPNVVEWLEPGLRRVLAPNPSPMTHWGTNSYIIGEGNVALIDPGPSDAGHLQALLDALGPGERISHILVTHSHVDHSPLARPLAEITGAPILAFGDSRAGRSAVMLDLAARGLTGGGEGVDTAFAPDEVLKDGQEVAGNGWSLNAIWTPGHFGNHICFQWDDIVFSGDHLMGWAPSLVSPPDGDLTAFMASTQRLVDLAPRVCLPGHGAPVVAPAERAIWLLAHRKGRETSILQALASGGPQDITTLTRAIYVDIPEAMHPMAARNLFAHLIDLHQRGLVSAKPELSLTADFTLTENDCNG